MSDEVKRGQIRREQEKNGKITESYNKNGAWGENALDTEHRNISRTPKSE